MLITIIAIVMTTGVLLYFAFAVWHLMRRQEGGNPPEARSVEEDEDGGDSWL